MEIDFPEKPSYCHLNTVRDRCKVPSPVLKTSTLLETGLTVLSQQPGTNFWIQAECTDCVSFEAELERGSCVVCVCVYARIRYLCMFRGYMPTSYTEFVEFILHLPPLDWISLFVILCRFYFVCVPFIPALRPLRRQGQVMSVSSKLACFICVCVCGWVN